MRKIKVKFQDEEHNKKSFKFNCEKLTYMTFYVTFYMQLLALTNE
jgi:hypothetical protein